MQLSCLSSHQSVHRIYAVYTSMLQRGKLYDAFEITRGFAGFLGDMACLQLGVSTL